MAKEMVNHPSHYNSHPAGIECIDVIRHYVCDIANAIKYLWRAGLKAELGKDDADKEIEDLKKALWYIEDYRGHTRSWNVVTGVYEMVCKATGSQVIGITQGYDKHIREAMQNLLLVGLVYDGSVVSAAHPKALLDDATRAIQQRILAINKQLVDADIDDCQKMLRGEWVEGIDTVKPACKRETEPADYDPMNLIIIQGTAYGLTSEVRQKDNGALYSPCELCAFHNICANEGDPDKMICVVLNCANSSDYFREVGDARYAPSFGTIQIVDAQKELEAELREINEEK